MKQVRVLKKIRPLTKDDIIFGQYGPNADGTKKGYLDDETVPKGSKTPTYAAAIMYVDDVRWRGTAC